MIILQGPHPNYQTTSVFPNPQLDDTFGNVVSMTLKKAVDGTRYTYVQKSPRRKFKYYFKGLTTDKAQELEAFYNSYSASLIRLTDPEGVAWLVRFTNDPWEFAEEHKRYQSIGIEFQGVTL